MRKIAFSADVGNWLHPSDQRQIVVAYPLIIISAGVLLFPFIISSQVLSKAFQDQKFLQYSSYLYS